MKTFRKIIFWAHLAAGLVGAISIGIMCFTGAVLAFEKQIVAWSERDARRVEVPANASRLPLDELQAKVREAKPEARPSGIVIFANPRDAVAFSLGREGSLYANPYTGEVRTPASTTTREFLSLMVNWHRVLALSGDQRPIGKAINGACNLAFAFLAISGLYLWWPRSLSTRAFKAVILFNWRLVGKARDFNWHNVIGLWSAPILIVLTLTAVPISYRWGGNLIIRLAGETVPAATTAPAGPGAAATPAVEIPRPAPGTRPLSQDELVASVQKAFPAWETLTLRTSGGGGPGAAATPPRENTPRAETNNAPRRGAGENSERRGPPAATITVKEANSWPRTATTTVTLNPFTGEILKTEGYADLPTSRQIRSWTRFLHTGEALGLIGQLVAGLACVGGCVLVYTGIALSCRRFFGKKKTEAQA